MKHPTPFDRDLLDAGTMHGAKLEEKIARDLVDECLEFIFEEDYRHARELALIKYVPLDATDAEWEGYKELLDRNFYRRLNKYQALRERPFAPLEAYKGDMY